MNTQTIDGILYAHMLLGGAALLSAHTDELNALNVFPVSDGDTGTNMLKTMEGGLSDLEEGKPESIGRLSQNFAQGVLLSARGNSGVILSQIFAGINEELKNYDKVGALELAKAYRNGIARSYAAVQQPTEGTILTVFRESVEFAAANITEESSVEDFLRLHIQQARRSLAATKELLPVLAEADVVDSGAAGYLYIAEGMFQVLTGTALPYTPAAIKAEKAVDISRFTRDSVLEFGYCTEFLLRLTTAKVDPDQFQIDTILSQLKALNGESIVAYKQDDIVKVHVHTFHPGEVLARMQAYGEFLTVKIENMSLGHQETLEKKEQKKLFSVVTVASGDGLQALFSQMGADQIISGGQTANPSTEEFLDAFGKCNSEHILVLPNNKNVILAAKQAAELYTAAQVHIIETKNLAQGYSALSVINPGIKDIQVLISSAEHAAAGVLDGEITMASRNAVIDGKTICQGDYIAISAGEITCVAQSPEQAVLALLEGLDMDFYEIITLFTGRNVSCDTRVTLTQTLQETYPDQEIVVYEGNQEVYDYFLAIE